MGLNGSLCGDKQATKNQFNMWTEQVDITVRIGMYRFEYQSER